MSAINFTKAELAAAVARGVRQLVLIGPHPFLSGALQTPTPQSLPVFAVDEQPPSEPLATFVETEFSSEALEMALARSDFDRVKACLFVWLGGAGYRTIDAVIASLAFIASLPKGSGVVLNYAVERTFPGLLSQTALDALASRISLVSGGVKELIQPEAVVGMLGSLGFRNIVDLAEDEVLENGGHLVSAMV